MVDNFILTLSITKDPNDGKLCSHSTTLMIMSLLTPSKRMHYKDCFPKSMLIHMESKNCWALSVLSEGHKGLERGSFLISFPRHVLTSEISRGEASAPCPCVQIHSQISGNTCQYPPRMPSLCPTLIKWYHQAGPEGFQLSHHSMGMTCQFPVLESIPGLQKWCPWRHPLTWLCGEQKEKIQKFLYFKPTIYDSANSPHCPPIPRLLLI